MYLRCYKIPFLDKLLCKPASTSYGHYLYDMKHYMIIARKFNLEIIWISNSNYSHVPLKLKFNVVTNYSKSKFVNIFYIFIYNLIAVLDDFLLSKINLERNYFLKLKKNYADSFYRSNLTSIKLLKQDYKKIFKQELIEKYFYVTTKKIISINNRDNEYKNFQDKSDSLRSSNIKNLMPAIKYLRDLNYDIFRIGGKKIINTDYFIDLSDSYDKDLEWFIILHSNYLITSDNGFYAVSILLNKPVLILNAIEPISTFPIKNSDRIIYKKLYNNTLGTLVDLRSQFEMIIKGKMLNNDNFLKEYNFIENTEGEILEAVKDFLQAKMNHKKDQYISDIIKSLIGLKHKYIRKTNKKIFLGDGSVCPSFFKN